MKVSGHQQQKFLAQLAVKSPKSVTVSTFDKFADPFVSSKPVHVVHEARLPLNLRTLHFEGVMMQMLQTKKATNVTDGEYECLLKVTMEQADSSTWHEMRVGRVTLGLAHFSAEASQVHDDGELFL